MNRNSKATDYFIPLRYIRNDQMHRHCEESGTNDEAISWTELQINRLLHSTTLHSQWRNAPSLRGVCDEAICLYNQQIASFHYSYAPPGTFIKNSYQLFSLLSVLQWRNAP